MVNSRNLYNGIPAQQCENFHLVFEKFFNSEKFDHVIEIGTSYGGMSLFLYEQSLIHGFVFETYDTKIGPMLTAYKNVNKLIPFTYHKQDCFDILFNSDGKPVMDRKTVVRNVPISNITDLLKTKKCLLLCDGGNKVREVKQFAPFLQPNSYIMAHDYARNKEYFEANLKNKIWNWYEIGDWKIEEVLNRHNVIKSDWYEEFSNVVWLSCIKK